MKECKQLLQNLLKTKFYAFGNIQKILKTVFSNYYDHIKLLKINNNVIYIAVQAPYLLSHFIDLKKSILKQIQENSPEIVDIIFLYKNNTKVKPTIITKNQHSKKDVSEPISSSEKEKIYNMIKLRCHKEDYHELLYQLYLKTIQK